MVWLAAGLPPQTFYAGDSGVKLIAAINTLDHPRRPFDIDLPAIAGRRVPYVERFFDVHGDHAHAIQSPLFPALSAIPISILGLRGAYIFPIVSFLAMLPLLTLVAGAMDRHVSLAALAIITFFASPLFFYALEFWEHAPAVALLTASTALVLVPSPPERRGISPAVGAGVLAGLAILLRPEALWYAAALAWIAGPPFRRTLVFGVGIAIPLVPFAIANVAHAGNPFGPHVVTALGTIWDDWFMAHVVRTRLWLLPGPGIAWVGFAIIGATWLKPISRLDLPTRQTVALAGAAVIAVASVRGGFVREALWNAWPAGALVLIPFTGTTVTRQLWFLAAFSVAVILLTSAHDGGAQWGPRFLLVATPPLLLLAACAATDAIQPGTGRQARAGLLLVVLIAGLWTTRTAYRDLRGSKQAYANLVAAVDAETSPGSYLVSNVWWFDQVVASLYGTRIFLYAPDVYAAGQILGELAAANISEVTLVWTGEADGEPLNAAVTGSCFAIADARRIAEREIQLARATCLAAR
jgi:hypothetical protein